MCGHGTIGTITIALEEGLIQPKKPGFVRMEAPAGLVLIEYKQEGRKVKSVKLTNVPSFLAAEKVEVECPDLGVLQVDVSYGGNFYAIVDPQKNFKGLEHYNADQLISWSRVMRQRINESHTFVHPDNPTIHSCTHILWAGKTLSPEATARNAVFYGDKAIDRSPCGTGTSARMAQGRVEKAVTVAGKPAIVPSIEGWAKIYGYNTMTIDPEDDPYAYGFQVL
jgi:4-hydroxyproline epimerase